MKKILSLLLALTVLFAGCKKDDPNPEIKLTDDTVEVPSDAGRAKITFSTNYDWEAASDQGWAKVSPASGPAGNATLEIKVDPNTTYDDRDAVITLQARDLRRTVTVTQAKYVPQLTLSADRLDFDMRTNVENVTVSSVTSWNVTVTPVSEVWCTASRSGNTLKVRATTNTTSSTREATVKVTSRTESREIRVIQEAYDGVAYYNDGEVVKLKSATRTGSNARGINIIVSGDGYVVDQMQRGNGKFFRDMDNAWKNFLSIAPYTDYADYFNVYMIAAVSNEEGMSRKTPAKTVDNKFQSTWEGTSTSIDSDVSFVRNTWVNNVTELSGVPLSELTFIMPVNEDQYAGTSNMYHDGFSVSICPVETKPDAFRKLVCHEAGGHGFGRLIDEYIYHQEQLPADQKLRIQNNQRDYGMYKNVDFTSNVEESLWAGFKDVSLGAKYSMVDCFDGGYMYLIGIWRPEYNSSMNNNVLYYNAQSRWLIVERISRIAGLGITFDDFVANEVIPPYPAGAYSPNYVEKGFAPLGAPIFIGPDGKETRLSDL